LKVGEKKEEEETDLSRRRRIGGGEVAETGERRRDQRGIGEEKKAA